MAKRVRTTAKFLCVVVGGVGGLFALIWVVGNGSAEGGEAAALATAYAAASDEVRARVGTILSTTNAAGESRCISRTEIPPTGDATFTLLVTGTRGHAKLDVRATRDEQGWHLVEAKMRPNDDGPLAVSSGCPTGPNWELRNYGKH